MLFLHLPLLLLHCVLVTAIWPEPAHYTHGDGVVWWLDSDVPIKLAGLPRAPTSDHIQYVLEPQWPGPEDTLDLNVVDAAIQRARKTLFEGNIVPWGFHPRDSDFEPVFEDHDHNAVDSAVLKQVDVKHLKALLPFSTSHTNEAYILNLTRSGLITIIACSATGFSYGLTTLTQLFFRHTSGKVYTNLAPIYITDAPKYGHRGLNLDVSRSFYAVEHIERTLGAMAYNKMNRLHLHITDSQAWPLEVPSLPDLARKGAYQPGMIYSVEDLERIQKYGALLGIEVYLEIDMPGHTSSIHHSFPELIAAYDLQPSWNTVAAEPPSGTMKLNSSAVYDFLGTLWDDVLPRMAPHTKMWHTGGDEVNIKAYELDDTVQSSNPKVIQPLLQQFIDQAHSRIRSSGLTPVVWEEMLLHHNITLGKDVIVQTWLDSASTVKVVEAGHRVIVGTHTHWYLDCGHGAWLDNSSGADETYPDWCGPRKNWRRIHSLDPLDGIPEYLHQLVLGGEVSLWSEQTDEVNLDVMLWPRTAATAEVLWSGARDMKKQSEASRRLTEMRDRLVAAGVRAEPVRMRWCEMEGGCVG